MHIMQKKLLRMLGPQHIKTRTFMIHGGASHLSLLTSIKRLWQQTEKIKNEQLLFNAPQPALSFAVVVSLSKK